jgi:hypothetical protein
MKNKIIADHGNWLEIDVSTPSYPNAIMKIDSRDWKYLQSLNIGRVGANGKSTAYARCSCTKIGGKQEWFLVHKRIMDTDFGVAHINGNGLDNRRCNLKPFENRILSDNGSWVEVDISTTKFPFASMKIDAPDWKHIQSLGYGKISIQRVTDALFYACCYERLEGGRFKSHKVHRLLLPNAKMIDHKNHDGTDNRQQNIRPCTSAENNRNARRRSDNTSGQCGVCLRKGRWRSVINVDKKAVYLGSFVNKSEAISVRKNAEKEYHGAFACA